MIVVMAGHVDHGKTSLIELITGKNTDQLEEERNRGLTIDLGFAYLETDYGRIGFVDVPGHKKFIHNMIAGISQTQHALLVVAADDGPMPQTVEHIELLQLAGIDSGSIVITKSDLVTEKQRNIVYEGTRTLIEKTFLKDSSFFFTRKEKDGNLIKLTQHLNTINRNKTQEDPNNPFRMAIDRAFNIHGAGVVVTGTVLSGSISTDQKLFVSPHNTAVRVRKIHAQNEETDTSIIGDRCALNIVGIPRSDVSRGSWLTEKKQSPTYTLFIQTERWTKKNKDIKTVERVHLYHGTAHTTGRIIRLNSEDKATGIIEVNTDEPLFCKSGDRILIRNSSLTSTVTGGRVIMNHGLPGRRTDKNRNSILDAYTRGSPLSVLNHLLEIGPVELNSFEQNWNIDERAVLQGLDQKKITYINDHIIDIAMWSKWKRALLQEITSALSNDSTKTGLRINELNTSFPDHFKSTLLKEITEEGKIRSAGGLFAHKDHKIQLSKKEEQILETINKQIDSLQPAALGDLTTLTGLPRNDLITILDSLTKKKLLVRVSSVRYYLPNRVEELGTIASKLASQGPFTVRSYRDEVKIGRNAAIEVLEYLDSIGHTIRSGSTRTISGEGFNREKMIE